jgi:hypothetical protein
VTHGLLQVAEFPLNPDKDSPMVVAEVSVADFQSKFDSDALPKAVPRKLLFDAFKDFGKLEIQAIPGGKSGANVLLVTPSLNDRRKRFLPFLAKIDSLDKASQERSKYESIVKDIIPFRLHPTLHPERCRSSGSESLLVFDFIERSLSFRRALHTCTPGQLIASVFDHTLGGCRIGSTDIYGSMVSAFAKLKLLDPTDALEAAADKARELEPSIIDFPDLRNKFLSLPDFKHRLGVVHGDLHTGNLLVAGGSTDVLLIDFASIQQDLPLAFDPACLEVSIAFCPKDQASELKRKLPSEDRDWLLHAYTYPLHPADLPFRSGSQQHVAEAVRAIRAEARKAETSPIPYALAVGAYLLRYASYQDHAALSCRAFAYALASRLVVSAAIAAHAAAASRNTPSKNEAD